MGNIFLPFRKMLMNWFQTGLNLQKNKTSFKILHVPEVSATERHSIGDTANATATNQCISLTPGCVF